ncbi:MAG: hypothetical protein V2B20_08685 [Pseudomonadota bacterium]
MEIDHGQSVKVGYGFYPSSSLNLEEPDGNNAPTSSSTPQIKKKLLEKSKPSAHSPSD